MKFYIHGKPGSVPNILSSTDVLLHSDEYEHRLVHEFDAENVSEARAYYDGYIARWQETPDMVQDVFEFHELLDVARPDFLTKHPGNELLRLRINLIEEEWCEELHPALLQLRNLQNEPTDHRHDEALVEVADGIADSIYVLIGCAISLGIPLKAVWREVQRSNMAKRGPNGVVKRDDGKVLKPDGWTPPDIYGVLGLEEPPPFTEPKEEPTELLPLEERTFLLEGTPEQRRLQVERLAAYGWYPFTPGRDLFGEDNGVLRRVKFHRKHKKR